MKKLLALILSVMLAATLAVGISAIGEEMTAVGGTPTIDGVKDDVWSTADTQVLSHVKAGDLKGDGTMPEGLEVKASVLWDSSALYFLFEITDDDFSFDAVEGAGAWQNDSIYLYVDENDVFGPTWNPGQNQIALIPAADLSLFNRKGDPLPEGYELAYTFPTDNTCVMEFKYVPGVWKLAEGLEILVDFQYNDGNVNGTRDYCLGWSDETDNAANDSSNWGFVTLGAAAEAPAAPVEETPAEVEAPAEAPAEVETPAPVEVETPAPVETPAEVETTPAPAPTVAVQTGDVTTVLTLVLAIAALCAFAITRKQSAK